MRRAPDADAGARVRPVVSFRPWAKLIHPRSQRAVLALNGGSSDELILRLTTAMAKGSEAELVAVHVVEVDWTLPIDADIAGNSEEAQRVLDVRRRGGRSRPRSSSSRSCSRPATSARPSSTRPASGSADLLVIGPAVQEAVRRRLRDRPDRALRAEERAVRGLGRARADPGGDRREDRHRRLRPGRLRPRRRLRRGRPRGDRPRPLDPGVRPPAVVVPRRRHPRRRHRRGHPPPGGRRGRRRLHRDDRRRQPQRHGRPAGPRGARRSGR